MLQSVISAILPQQCAMCDAHVEGEGGLCGACWRQMPFIDGLCCDACGAPLLGEDAGDPICDDCLIVERPWSRGRAAVLYRGTGRKLVLALKHGDRLDLVAPASKWMVRAAQPILGPESVLVPIPAHWMRLLSRRYNQAALLAQAVARRTGHDYIPRALVRPRRTAIQEGKSRDRRFADLSGAIEPCPRRGDALEGRPVILVDDVFTSGATLAAATEACRIAGAARVDILALARVAREA